MDFLGSNLPDNRVAGLDPLPQSWAAMQVVVIYPPSSLTQSILTGLSPADSQDAATPSTRSQAS